MNGIAYGFYLIGLLGVIILFMFAGIIIIGGIIEWIYDKFINNKK